MSWKAIDSRANTSGSALYSDTVFYNKTNHNYVKDSQLSGDLKVANLTVSDTLTVDGDTSLSGSSLTVNGATSLSGGSLTVVGATSLSGGSLTVNGATNLSGGSLTVVGATSLSGGPLTVDGEVSVTQGDINVTQGDINVTGGITATEAVTGNTLVSKGDVTCFSSSDRRLKEEITQIENAGEIVDKLRGVRFKWRDEWFKENEVILAHQDDMGFIAQEVEEVVPEMVSEKGNGYKGISYHKLVPLLLETVKDLRQDVRRLEGEIKEIRANHD